LLNGDGKKKKSRETKNGAQNCDYEKGRNCEGRNYEGRHCEE
jgi:hypothetical protein